MVTNTNNKRPAQWLALHFPHLALDQHNRTREQGQENTPQAISDSLAGRQCIIDYNQAAERVGIHIGMPVGTALSLSDLLRISSRNQRAEQAALKRLASWCYQYSSQVCIVAQRNSLLLEVAGSQCLFGNAENLAERICTELKQLGYQSDSGIAPTPEAAHLAARHNLHIRTIGAIRGHIGTLGIDCLNLPPASLQALKKMGFRNAAEIFRLPGKALSRRLGLAVSDYLERLLGQRPDPCKTFHPPDSFSTGMDLPDTENTQGLVFPLNRLIQELCGVLRAHDRGVQTLQIHLQIGDSTETIHLNLHQPTRSESHLMMLLRERLERLQLSRPARHISLQALNFLPCTVTQTSLLEQIDKPSATAANTVIERLQARLGTESVKGIKGLQDHRPEHSWALRELDEAASYAARPDRPTWLLPAPQRCRIDNYRILKGPERIESGWWDGKDCRRDYFVVRDSSGSTLWAFHEYKPHPGWYLQGLFS